MELGVGAEQSIIVVCEWLRAPRPQIRAVRFQAADLQPPCSAAGAAALLHFVDDDDDEEEEEGRWRGLFLLLHCFYCLHQTNVKELHQWKNVTR